MLIDSSDLKVWVLLRVWSILFDVAFLALVGADVEEPGKELFCDVYTVPTQRPMTMGSPSTCAFAFGKLISSSMLVQFMPP